MTKPVTDAEIDKAIERMTDEEGAALLVKASHRNPKTLKPGVEKLQPRS